MHRCQSGVFQSLIFKVFLLLFVHKKKTLPKLGFHLNRGTIEPLAECDPITVGAEDLHGLAGSLQPDLAHFGQDIDGGKPSFFPRRRFDDCKQFGLQ